MKSKFNFPSIQLVKNSISYFLVLFLIISCNQSTESKITNSIQNLIEKYPQLTVDKKTPKGREFKFIKSAREGKFNIEIQLYGQEEYTKNRNQILIIINGKKEIFAIPLFNNKYRDYWEFPFDKVLPEVPKTNTTFSNEFNTAIDKLIPNNDRRKSLKRSTLIDETVNSILNCQRLSAKDSLMISNPVLSTIDIPIENIDSTKIRLHKNYILMRLNLHLNSDNSNCYLDRENGRIYQIEYHGNKIKVKAYRMDFGMPHPIYL